MNKKQVAQSDFIKETLKGVCVSVLITLIAVFIFGLIVKWASLNSAVIKPVNQFIKTLSLFIGCYFAVKGSGGYWKGALIGFFAMVVTYLVFMLISKTSGSVGAFMLDLLFGIIVGAISGVLGVNLRSKQI